MIHRLIPLLFVFALISSCRKDRTCACVISIHQYSNEPGVSYPAQPARKKSTTYEDIKSGDPALESCINSETTEEFPYTSNGTQYTVTRVTNNRCEVK